LAKFDLKEYARRGAQARAAELQAELTEIVRAFPDLRVRPRGRRAASATRSPERTGGARHRPSPMTAAQRKAVSVRMKKYWAERRSAKSGK
jgi:hypothetical protein